VNLTLEQSKRLYRQTILTNKQPKPHPTIASTTATTEQQKLSATT